jgi:hypothetical protein
MNLRLLILFAGLGSSAWGHIGSPDIFHEGNAGPYPVLVTIRPPLVIPGIAEVEIRCTAPGIREIRIVPTPLSGAGARYAPTPDVAKRSKDDPQFYTGGLWIMTTGPWQVKLAVDGEGGLGQLAVPVPALANRTTKMQFGLGAGLSVLVLILAVGAISIVGAAAREAQLEPGQKPAPSNFSKARVFMAVTAALVVGVMFLSNQWWNVEANAYSRLVFKPLAMSPQLQPGGRLELTLSDPGWLPSRKTDDFLPDHSHLMHLYVIRLPEMERVWHLHPEMTSSAVFTQKLPPMPAGKYALYGDLVHENGLPETVVADIDLPEVTGTPLEGDDAAGSGTSRSQAKPDTTTAELGDGYRMVWLREPSPLKTKQATWFRFRVEDAHGKPAEDMELYMGMQGHAAFLKTDRSVFAHVHPSGSVPMAMLGLTNADPHSMHDMQGGALPAVVSFPYGFPSPGEYRIFVQAKRGGRVETGVFDARVD